MIIVCDIDGTLSDCRHRQHLAAAGDWDAFHALMHKDPPNLAVLNYLRQQITLESGIIFLTGRPEEYRSATIKWLQDVCDLQEDDDYGDLLMRPKGNFRSDVEVKLELLNDSIEQGFISGWLGADLSDIGLDLQSTNELLFLEDRDKVAAMWRDQGYHCWQVAEGAF